jgi:hypothetical protein
MNTTYWLILSLSVLLAIYTGAQAIPVLVLLYAPRLLKFWFIDPAESDRWIGASPALQEKIKQMGELGFVSLGIKVEKIMWEKPVYEVSLSNTEKEAFGAIMLTADKQVLGVYFYTALSGGGIVFTRGHSRMPEIELPDASIKNNLTGDLKAMLSSHSQRIRVFKQRGHSVLPVSDQASRIEATYIFYESMYMKQVRRKLPRMLPVINFALAVGLLMVVVLTYIFRLAAG